MTISSSDMGRLNPLLSTTAAEMERVAPESDNTWITGSLQSLDGQGNPIPYLQSASHPVLTSIQENT